MTRGDILMFQLWNQVLQIQGFVWESLFSGMECWNGMLEWWNTGVAEQSPP